MLNVFLIGMGSEQGIAFDVWTIIAIFFSLDFSRFCSQNNCSTKTKGFYGVLNFWENRSYLPPSSIIVVTHVYSS